MLYWRLTRHVCPWPLEIEWGKLLAGTQWDGGENVGSLQMQVDYMSGNEIGGEGWSWRKRLRRWEVGKSTGQIRGDNGVESSWTETNYWWGGWQRGEVTEWWRWGNLCRLHRNFETRTIFDICPKDLQQVHWEGRLHELKVALENEVRKKPSLISDWKEEWRWTQAHCTNSACGRVPPDTQPRRLNFSKILHCSVKRSDWRMRRLVPLGRHWVQNNKEEPAEVGNKSHAWQKEVGPLP